MDHDPQLREHILAVWSDTTTRNRGYVCPTSEPNVTANAAALR